MKKSLNWNRSWNQKSWLWNWMSRILGWNQKKFKGRLAGIRFRWDLTHKRKMHIQVTTESEKFYIKILPVPVHFDPV